MKIYIANGYKVFGFLGWYILIKHSSLILGHDLRQIRQLAHAR